MSARLPLPTKPACYWVRPGALLAGAYPGGLVAALARPKLERLLALGVGSFIDLTEPHEYGMPAYEPLARSLAARAQPIRYTRRPIRDMGVPTPAGMRALLDYIDTELAMGHVVYLHCMGGVGRTGTIVGCWLIRHGVPAGQALATIAGLRAGLPGPPGASPETAAQRALVCGWRE